MAIELQQILLAMAFALLFLVLNLKSAYDWYAFTTFTLMLVSVVGAIFLAVRWMW